MNRDEREHDATGNGKARSAVGTGGTQRRLFGGRGIALLGAGVLLGVLGATALSTQAHGGFGRMMHRSADPAKMAEHINRRVDRMLEAVDATADQETRIESIVERTVESVAPRFKDHRGWRDQMLAALAAPEVDREGLDAIRQSHLDLMSSVSAELVDAATEIATVLTAEQRAQVAEHMQARRQRHGRGEGQGHGKRHGKGHGHGHGSKHSDEQGRGKQGIQEQPTS